MIEIALLTTLVCLCLIHMKALREIQETKRHIEIVAVELAETSSELRLIREIIGYMNVK